MKNFKVEFLEVTLKEATKIEEMGGKVEVLFTWEDIEAESYYKAQVEALPTLKNTLFGQSFKKNYGRELGIADVIKHLRVTSNEKIGKPENGYIEPLITELKEARELA